MTPLLIFALQFVTVFALGAQSLNVNGGHYRLAALTSIIISLGSLGGTWLTIVRNEPDGANIAAFIVGSILGITSAMRAHPTLVRWLGRQDHFADASNMVDDPHTESAVRALRSIERQQQYCHSDNIAFDTDPPTDHTERGAQRYADEVATRIKGTT